VAERTLTSACELVSGSTRVASQLTANLYGQYAFDGGFLKDTSVRIGVRNLTDEAPPLTSSGYFANMYQPYGRYWYASLKKSF
jgi:outer membrane receptor protein involved in Fe transport